MSVTILLVGIAFALFLAMLMYVISLLWTLPSLVMYGVAALGAAFFVFVEYLIGPWVVSRAASLQYLDSGENPWLENTVRQLASQSGLPTPKIAVVPDETPNAFVFGRTAKSATLALHEGLLRNLNEGEIKRGDRSRIRASAS